jgi:hypothetical protein
MRAVFIAAIILTVFYVSYNDLVGNPFDGKLELGEYFGKAADVMEDPSEIPIPKILLVIVAFAFPRLIRLMFSDPPDKRSRQDEEPINQQ